MKFILLQTLILLLFAANLYLAWKWGYYYGRREQLWEDTKWFKELLEKYKKEIGGEINGQ